MSHQEQRSPSPAEWRRVLVFTAILILATTGPYILAGLRAGDEWVFSGGLFGVTDTNTYLARMRLGGRGFWEVFLFYTPEPHDGVPFLYLPYTLPGHLIGLFVSPNTLQFHRMAVLVFHLIRVGGLLGLVVLTYHFIARFIPSPAWRLTALVLVFWGGGFGWLLLLMTGRIPPEFYIPEDFSMLVVSGLPHIVLSRLTMFGGFLALFRALAVDTGWGRWSVLAGLCWAALSLNVAIYTGALYAVIGAWGALVWWRQRRFPTRLVVRTTVAVGISLPFFLYVAYHFTQNETFAAWKSISSVSLSNRVTLKSPSPFINLLTFAPLGLLAWWGGRWVWRHHPEPPHLLLVAWCGAALVLVHLPVGPQRRLAEGVIYPLAILAAVGLRAILIGSQLGPRVQRQLRAATVVALTTSSLLFVLGVLLGNALSLQPPVYVQRARASALVQLNATAPPDSVILASLDTSSKLPVYANMRVVVGHPMETLNFWDKLALVDAYLNDDMTAAERRQLYTTYRVRYVFYGPQERALLEERAGASPPAWQQDVTLVYERAGYQIYAVNAEQYR